MMKKFTLLLLSLLFTAELFAQNWIVHTVQKGETLQSIASFYGSTTDELLKTNPSASRIFYVGMKLYITQKKSVETIVGDDSQRKKEKEERKTVIFPMKGELSPTIALGISSFSCSDKSVKPQPRFSPYVGASYSLNVYHDFWIDASLGFIQKGSISQPMNYIMLGLSPLKYRYDLWGNDLCINASFQLGFPLSRISTSKNTFKSNLDFGMNIGVGYRITDHTFGIAWQPSFTRVCSSNLKFNNYGFYLTYSYCIFKHEGNQR